MSKTIASIYGKTPEQWILVEVGDLIASGQAELQTGPFGTMLHASVYKSVGTPVVAGQHIGENRLRHVDLLRVDDETRNGTALICLGKEIEDDDEPFEEKMQRFTATLRQQLVGGAKETVTARQTGESGADRARAS